MSETPITFKNKAEALAFFREAVAEERKAASAHPDTPLHNLVDSFLAGRGKEVEHSPFHAPVAIGDEDDGRGQFITKWDVEALGPAPTEADGFTADQLRAIQSGPVG